MMASSEPITPELSRRLAPYAWWLVVLGSLGFLAWTTYVRIGRVNYLSGLPGWSVSAPEEDPQSPTGYAREQRRLIVPGHHNASYRWIMQTQQMLTQGDWRVRHVDYDNAPAGRDSHSTSPYRWWLALVAWIDHLMTGRSMPLAVEHAALYADPLLHGLLVISVVLFAAHYFGCLAGAMGAVALVTLFPLAAGFQPGAPDNHALSWVFALWSILPLIVGLCKHPACSPEVTHDGKTPATPRRWFYFAGIAGGIGMWNDTASEWPVIAGLGLGALIAQFAFRFRKAGGKPEILPWRAWSLAGAATCLIGYQIEYFPSRMALAVQSIHPLHAVAWLGLGELLVCGGNCSQFGRKFWSWHTLTVALLAIIAVAALPVTMRLTKSGHFLAPDPFATELANLSPAAADVRSWIARDGFTPAFWAVCLPVSIVGVALSLLITRKSPQSQRHLLVVVLGPAVAALLLAWQQLRWWNLFDATSVVLLLAIFKMTVGLERSSLRRSRWAVLLCLPLILGVVLVFPRTGSRAGDPPRGTEKREVAERDLAHWLVQQNWPEKSVVFTTPDLTEALIFYGSLKGLGTTDWENNDGLTASARIAGSGTPFEALTLLKSRGVTHLVLPSRDPALDQLIRRGRRIPDGGTLPGDTLINAIQHWELPLWLWPMSYHIPPESGFQDDTVTVLAVRNEQDEILATCRLADYFIEMRMMTEAQWIHRQLGLFPRDLSALTALAHIDRTIGDMSGYEKNLAALLPYLSRRAVRTLPLDRRISLATLLVHAEQIDAARVQIKQCLAEINPAKIRELTTGALVHMLALSKLLGVEFYDPQMRSLALSLLSPELRKQLDAVSPEKSHAR